MGLSSEDIHVLKYALVLFLQPCFTNGVVKLLGICLPDITVALELTALETGTMFGLYKAAIFCPGPVIAYLYDYKKCRRVLLVLGAVTSSMGIVLASLSTSSSFLIAAVTLSGLGRGVVTMLAVIGLSNVQPSRFSTYYGIGKSGYAVGMLVVPLMSDFLLKVYGWRVAMLGGSWYSYVIPRAMDRGVSSSHAIYLSFSAAIATFLGRAFSGAASQY
ncbi:monocarboxylate transporter 12-like [Diadema antillarum]|uniref:monocarboxylate transporter 12-like n=1 Tax=Diadema antillarum TaxID=105358 RepID=UPI003A844ED3